MRSQEASAHGELTFSSDDCSGGVCCIFKDGVEPMVAAMTRPLEGQNVSTFVVDNSRWNATTKGLAYRTDRDLRAKADFDDAFAAWGSTVRGVEVEGGWLQVGQWFLPLLLEGVAVVVPGRGEDSEPEVVRSPVSDFCLEGEASQIQEFVSPPSFLDSFRKLRQRVDEELRQCTAGPCDFKLAYEEGGEDRCRGPAAPAAPGPPADSLGAHWRLPSAFSPPSHTSAGTARHPGEGVADSQLAGGIPELRRLDHSRPLPSRSTTSHDDDPWTPAPVSYSPAMGYPWRGSFAWCSRADANLAEEGRRAERARAESWAPGHPRDGACSFDGVPGARPASPPRCSSWRPGCGAPPPHAEGAHAGSGSGAHRTAGAACRGAERARPQSPQPRRPEPRPPQGTPTRPQPRRAADSRLSAAPPAGGDTSPGEAATLAELETRLQRLRYASKEEQRRGSKELMVQWHPDKNIGKNAEAKRIFQWLQNRRKELGIGQ
mmetsp:Transcript_109302/g.296428  ORF Transcript_109302/g.296428 Transcript_109302/m.296428 type:complete len:488 (-) Transcript_109302:122-1585(-)